MGIDPRAVSVQSVPPRAPYRIPDAMEVLGGEFGMGQGVADCFMQVARYVDCVQVDNAGRYPAEQRPTEVNASSLISFLDRYLAQDM